MTDLICPNSFIGGAGFSLHAESVVALKYLLGPKDSLANKSCFTMMFLLPASG